MIEYRIIIWKKFLYLDGMVHFYLSNLERGKFLKKYFQSIFDRWQKEIFKEKNSLLYW